MEKSELNPLEEIKRLLPHREPFLWVDKILNFSENNQSICAEKKIPLDLPLFSGHYPGNPIMPGVLLCEGIFQTGALLMGKIAQNNSDITAGVPVLSRVDSAKFKRIVKPGETVTMEVKLSEVLSGAYIFKGKMKVDNKTAVQVNFTCTMVASDQ